MKKIIVIPSVFFLLSAIFYFSFTSETIYNQSLRKITKNYLRINDTLKYSYVPYTAIDSKKILNWDAAHYYEIKENNYSFSEESGYQYLFAFFPLFPYFWKVFGLGSYGVVLMNFFLLMIGIYFIMKIINSTSKNQTFQLLLICCLPLNVVFFIPYTEALFFATLSFGFFGYTRKNYLFYFLGLSMAAMTRPSAVIILFSMLLTEVYFWLQKHDLKSGIIRFTKNASPLIVGTLIISTIQIVYGSNGILGFYEAQNSWGWELSWPQNIEDWSMEQYTLNISVIFLLAPLVLYIPLRQLFYRKERTFSPLSYIFILSSIYIIGTTLYCLLYHKGSLNGIFRYTACTPFFVLWLLILLRSKKIIPLELITHSTLLLLLITAIFLSSNCSFSPYWGVEGLPLSYGPTWRFLDSGFYIVSATLISVLLKIFSFNKSSNWLLVIILIYNALWTSYLFNTFLVNGPLFT